MKPQPNKARATNVKVEQVSEEEEEYPITYIKNYYGEVHYHVYAGGYFVDQAGNPPPPPPYGGGG